MIQLYLQCLVICSTNYLPAISLQVSAKRLTLESQVRTCSTLFPTNYLRLALKEHYSQGIDTTLNTQVFSSTVNHIKDCY